MVQMTKSVKPKPQVQTITYTPPLENETFLAYTRRVMITDDNYNLFLTSLRREEQLAAFPRIPDGWMRNRQRYPEDEFKDNDDDEFSDDDDE